MRLLPFSNSNMADAGAEGSPVLLEEEESGEKTPDSSSLGLLSRLSKCSLSGHVYVLLSCVVHTVNVTIVKVLS